VSLIRSLIRPPAARATAYSWDNLAEWIGTAGYPMLNQTWSATEEKIEGDFRGLVRGAYQSNGVVFACLLTRFMLFSQARFQFQQLRGGQPGDLFGTPDLRLLENPEPGMVTGDLLAHAKLDADLAGDWFGIRRPGRVKRLRPDWTAVVVGTSNGDTQFPGLDPDAEVAGYSYAVNGYGAQGETWSFDVSEVAHYFPIWDPLSRYRGVPLPTAVMRDIRGDSAAQTHKLKFFENAATPNLIVKYPPSMTLAKAQESIDLFEQEHHGAYNAYRTMYLLGGADATAVGKDLQQMDFKATQGAGETRIAAAMNVHPAIVGLSEGLQGSSLNAGNFNAVRRLQADKMLWPAWGNMSASLETIAPPPTGARLWVDARHIPFLREDVKDAAEIMAIEATAMRTLGDGGWEHDAVVDAVTSGDLRRLRGAHTGLVPVQLQEPGSMAVVARVPFWPASGDWTGSEVSAGMVFAPDHPIVRSFPSLFEPAAADSYDPRAIRVVVPQPAQVPASTGG
jgi:hypothetical protein